MRTGYYTDDSIMPYAPILATLGYIFSPDRSRVLMVHRNARPGDVHLGKWNGLGGKLEPDEDIISGMRRELREEARIEATKLQLACTISWPGFGKQGEDWFGFIFRILEFTGSPPSENSEGTLAWIETARVLDLPLWSGDRLFLPRIFDFAAAPFHGVMPYEAGEPVSWSFSEE
jgi:8-oxo-dGTP diphosphatase